MQLAAAAGGGQRAGAAGQQVCSGRQRLGLVRCMPLSPGCQGMRGREPGSGAWSRQNGGTAQCWKFGRRGCTGARNTGTRERGQLKKGECTDGGERSSRAGRPCRGGMSAGEARLPAGRLPACSGFRSTGGQACKACVGSCGSPSPVGVQGRHGSACWLPEAEGYWIKAANTSVGHQTLERGCGGGGVGV